MTTKAAANEQELENAVWETDWRKVGLFITALVGAVAIALYVLNLPWFIVLILGILGLCIFAHLAGMLGGHATKSSSENKANAEEHAQRVAVVTRATVNQGAASTSAVKQPIANIRRAKIAGRQARAREYANTHKCKSGKRGRSGGKHDCCG